MAKHDFYCRKEIGAETIKRIISLIKAMNGIKTFNNIYISTVIKSFNSSIIENIEESTAIKGAVNFFNEFPELEIRNFSIDRRTGVNNNSISHKVVFSYIDENSLVSSLVLENFPDADTEKCYNALKNSFNLIRKDEAVFKTLPDYYKTQANVYHKNLEDMQSALSKFQTSIENQRTENDQYLREKEKEIEAKRKLLEEELKAEYTKKVEAVEQKEKKLEKIQSEIDDNDSKYARRQIRSEVKENILKKQTKFELTTGTNHKRLIIHAGFAGIIVVLCTLLVFSFKGIGMNQDAGNYILTAISYIRIPMLIIAIIGFAIYYIRWNDLWFRRHADEEFNLKQFELDFERASWVVEMAMEWNAEKGTEIPEELLDRLTKGLFESERNKSKPPKHISEDFLSMLLASSKLDLKLPGGGNAKVNGKAVNKALKQSSN